MATQVLGFWFHPRPVTPDTRAHGWPDPQPSDRAFYEALSGLSSKVIQRLQELKSRKALKAQVKPDKQSIGGKPRLYLHAAIGREDAWKSTRERLEEADFEIESAQLTAAGNSLLEVRRAQRERLAKLNTCHGLLVLLSDPTEDITVDIEACQADRTDIEAGGRRLPCAVLDTVGGEIPESLAAAMKAFAMEILPGRGPGWLAGVQRWLDRTHSPLVEAAE